MCVCVSQPLSASVLTLFTHRGVHVEVGTDRLVAMLKHLLTDPEEVCLNWLIIFYRQWSYDI